MKLFATILVLLIGSTQPSTIHAQENHGTFTYNSMETGPRLAFFEKHRNLPNSYSVIRTDPFGGGGNSRVHRFEIRTGECGSPLDQGDCSYNAVRSELAENNHRGTRFGRIQPREAWYEWDIGFPHGFPFGPRQTRSYYLFGQWHNGVCPHMNFGIWGGRNSHMQRGEKAEYHAKQYPMIVRRYFVEHFKGKLMSALKADDIDEYWDFRKEYWITGPGSKNPLIEYTRIIKGQKTKIFRPVKEGYPSKSTLHKESLLLRQLFEFGQRRGYVIEIPEIHAPKDKRRKDNSRPGFTWEEFMHLKSVSEDRVREYEFSQDDPTGKNQKTYQDRLRLHCFCMIAAFTGMRPTELFNLSWGDIEARKIHAENGELCDVTVMQVRGKGKEREMAAMPETLTFINLLKSLFYVATGRMPEDSDPVFFNHEGKRIRSFKIGLAKLLIAADLREARNGKLRDSFSFRHFYITQQIREGVGHHLLGRNVGTSSKMIDAYYSKIRPTDEIAQLIPDWSKKRLLQYRRK